MPGKVSETKKNTDDDDLRNKLHEMIQRFPTWGYRRLWAWLRFRETGFEFVNKKRVYRVLREERWLVKQRRKNPRPRVQRSRSVAKTSNQRWAIDATTFWAGRDGVAHVIAVMDCYDREIVGWEIAFRGRSREATNCLEKACLRRFGLLYPQEEKRPVLRSDNGKIFCSKAFRRTCSQFAMSQEFITPYTPEQNGMIERFFRSLKEECIWLNNFASFAEAKEKIEQWIRFYNEERPHQSLGYRSPCEVASNYLQQVA